MTNADLGVLADAGADRGRDHARLPHRVHAHGHGRVLRLARLPQRQPADRGPAGARPHGAAHLRRDVERRADRDSAVPVHGLPRRARAADRSAVPEPAPRHRARARLARGRDHRHLRDLRHRDRHRRRGGHADGAARVSGDAQGRLQHQGLGGRGHRRRLPRHPDPALGAADRLRRDRGRVGGAALRRRVLPGLHARVALHRLRHRAGEVEAPSHAAARRERAPRAAAAVRADAGRARPQRDQRLVPGSLGGGTRRRASARSRPARRHAAAGPRHRAASCWSPTGPRPRRWSRRAPPG